MPVERLPLPRDPGPLLSRLERAELLRQRIAQQQPASELAELAELVVELARDLRRLRNQVGNELAR